MLSFTANQAKTRFGELMNKAQHEAVLSLKMAAPPLSACQLKITKPLSNSS